MDTALETGRTSFEAHAWSDAFRELSAAEHLTPLEVDDLERLALAAYLSGNDDAAMDVWTRAHHEAIRRSDPSKAARCAFMVASSLLFRGEMAPAMGWIARGRRVLEESGAACAEEATLLVLTGLPMMFTGDAASALENFRQAAEIATAFGDPDTLAFARLGAGQSMCMLGNADEGLSLLDEAMVAVVSGEVSPLIAGIAYCATIGVCNDMFDLRRAREWTQALSRWCDAQPDLVPYRGNCLIHRCEIFQLSGEWPRALDAARQATEWLSGRTVRDTLGLAHYQSGEILRLRGEYSEAEDAYRKASQAGREPEPGLSLLRLAQGRVDVAAAAIRRVLEETEDPSGRARMLPAHVEIMLAAKDLPSARTSAAELEAMAAASRAPYLVAVAAHALGSVLLTEGKVREALTTLRGACNAWQELDAPHEAARVRVLIGLACRALGDGGTAEMELDAARAAFEELGATPDTERVLDLTDRSGGRPGGLSPREVEVLRLVAGGKTNRQIASELVLSEKTIARHVSNIFAKLGVPSRAAATAFAYKNDLV